jgi:hypothetical protein
MNEVGAFGGRCNRQSVACSNMASWFNHSTRKYYCRECAKLINEANPEWKREYGENLCTEGKHYDIR